MSFGYSVSDFITLGSLAWNVYKACKAAPESFGNISLEILSLHAVLKEVEEIVFVRPLASERQASLKVVGDGCYSVLNDLQSLVQKYHSLGTQSKRTWDRVNWHAEDISELRSRLVVNVTLLTTLISTSQASVEKKLDDFIREFREGKRECSLISTQTVESLSADERKVWRNIRKELEGVGITIAAFEANKEFILSWFKEAEASGAFEEQTINSTSAMVLYELPSVELSPSSLVPEPSSANDIPPSIKGRGPKIPLTLFRKSLARSLWIPRVSAFATTRTTRIFDKLREDDQQLNNKLLDTARTGDLFQVKELLKSGVNINCRDPKSRRTALHEAAISGESATVQLLLEAGADVNMKDPSGDTALHMASSNAYNVAVQLLLEKGADIDASNAAGYTALHEATFNMHYSTVLLLVQKGANINAKGAGEDTALHIVAREGHKELALLLLESGASTKEENYEGLQAVHDAAWEGHKAVISLLLDKGVNIDTQDALGGSVLAFVSYRGYIDIVLMLLSRGADVNRKAVMRRTVWDERLTENRTPLQEAAWAGHTVIVNILLKNGADLEATDGRGRTALHCAARNGHLETVQLLVRFGANIETKQVYGETALEEAIFYGHETVAMLLQQISKECSE
ncbi:hypothetical protein FGG08_003896 [Glutinoglossum americanum]|uniref:Ankyrin repeat protein n=1 Tax=Glutinoglossum americanum TaxID=1670608 RepID=A0A9P8I8Q1_9PEZI|nr:hypothetical protein FGG08_003896 [Glutinoglossum americanum]